MRFPYSSMLDGDGIKHELLAKIMRFAATSRLNAPFKLDIRNTQVSKREGGNGEREK